MSSSPAPGAAAAALNPARLYPSLPQLINQVRIGDPKLQPAMVHKIRFILKEQRTDIEKHFQALGQPSVYDDLPAVLDPAIPLNSADMPVAVTSRPASPVIRPPPSATNSPNPNVGSPNPGPSAAAVRPPAPGRPAFRPAPPPGTAASSSTASSPASSTASSQTLQQSKAKIANLWLSPFGPQLMPKMALPAQLASVRTWADLHLLPPPGRAAWFRLVPPAEKTYNDLLTTLTKFQMNPTGLAAQAAQQRKNQAAAAAAAAGGGGGAGAGAAPVGSSSGPAATASATSGPGARPTGIAGMAPRPPNANSASPGGAVRPAMSLAAAVGAGGGTTMPLPNLSIPAGAVRPPAAAAATAAAASGPSGLANLSSLAVGQLTQERVELFKQLTDEQAKSLQPEVRRQYVMVMDALAKQKEAASRRPSTGTVPTNGGATPSMNGSAGSRPGPGTPSQAQPRPPAGVQASLASNGASPQANKANLNQRVKDIMATEGGITAEQVITLYREAAIPITPEIRESIAKYVLQIKSKLPPPPPVHVRTLAVERVDRMLTEVNGGMPLSDDLTHFFTDMAEDLFTDLIAGGCEVHNSVPQGRNTGSVLQMRDVALYGKHSYSRVLPHQGLEPGFGNSDLKRKLGGDGGSDRAKRLKAVQARAAEDAAAA